jgi:hypothetical protein
VGTAAREKSRLDRPIKTGDAGAIGGREARYVQQIGSVLPTDCGKRIGIDLLLSQQLHQVASEPRKSDAQSPLESSNDSSAAATTALFQE